MNKSFFILAILCAWASFQSVTIIPACTCPQLLTSADCARKFGCSWDAANKTCIEPSTLVTPYSIYCDQYTMGTNCAADSPCAWNGKICIPFTACTAYTQTTGENCQAISTRCITDGVHCIEKGACSLYKTQKACFLNSNDKYCYWNVSNPQSPYCEDANDCSKLPLTLNTDALCRAQLSKCTSTAAGGCVELAVICADQIDKQGCAQNKDQSQACFWNSGKCYDLNSDNVVQLSQCTSKQGGSCRRTCSASIQASYVKDNTGASFVQNGTVCFNETFANALNTNTTNANYLGSTITTDDGCADNSDCETAKIQADYIKILFGAKQNY